MKPILRETGKDEIIQPVRQESLELISTLVARSVDKLSLSSQKGRLLRSTVFCFLKEEGQGFVPLFVFLVSELEVCDLGITK